MVTASLSADVLRFEKGDGSTFDIDFRDFVIEPETGSLYLGSSFDDVAQVITFTKGNGSTDLVDLSSFVTEVESGSLIYSASLDLNTNRFTFHRDHGDYNIDISNLSGLTLTNTIASGSFSGSFEGESTGLFTGSFTGSFDGLLTGIGSGSFSGSFEGDGSGLTGVGLDHTISSGDGIRSFIFDGSSDEIVTVDTGSTHFTEGVRNKITGAATGGPSGIEVNYDNQSGEISAAIVTPDITVGTSTLELGNTYTTLDGVQLTDVEATGSFTGSFEGDFILSRAVSEGNGIEPFHFNGQSDQIVSVDTGSAHFTEGVREKINVTDTTGASGVDLTYDEATGNIQATLVNSDVTFGNTTVELGASKSAIDGLQLTDVNATGSFTGSFEGDFILSKTVASGDGIEAFSFNGLSDQVVNLDTGSTHFTEGVREKINVTDTFGASGVDLTYDEATGNLQATLANSAVSLGNSTVALGDTLSAVDGLKLTDVNATGSFSGSFEGDFILSKNVSNGAGIETFSFDGQADQIVTLNTGSTHFTEGVREKINVTDTFGASGIDLTYNEATGNLQATIVNSAVSLGNSTVALGDTLSAVDGLKLTDVNATGSFSGSFTGDFILSKNVSNGLGIETFSFDGQADKLVTLNTGSTHFNDGIKAKLNTETVVSSSAQVVAHLPSGTVSGSSQITITESQISDLVHYTDTDTKAKLNLENVLSGSIESNLPAGVVSGSQQVIDHLPAGTVSGSSQITITESQISDLVHYTDTDVKNKMNLDNVVSGSLTSLLPSGVVSGSAAASSTQGSFTLTVNGVDTSVDLGLESTDDVKFASVYSGTGTKNASAILQADSTTQGFLPPRMTELERTNIANPATGLVVWQTDGYNTLLTPQGAVTAPLSGLWVYNGTNWQGPLSV